MSYKIKCNNNCISWKQIYQDIFFKWNPKTHFLKSRHIRMWAGPNFMIKMPLCNTNKSFRYLPTPTSWCIILQFWIYSYFDILISYSELRFHEIPHRFYLNGSPIAISQRLPHHYRIKAIYNLQTIFCVIYIVQYSGFQWYNWV